MRIRDSRFEILRIVSIFFIVVFHFSVYTPWSGALVGKEGLGYFIFMPFGQIGVKLFGLITGYFMIQRKLTFQDIMRKILYVWKEVLFYSLGIEIILQVMFGLNLVHLIKAFLPLLFNQYWFATSYVLVMLLAPFLNTLLDSLNKEMQKRLVLISLFISEVLPLFHNTNAGNTTSLFVLLSTYLVGAYIYKNKIRISSSINILGIVLCITIIYLSYFIFSLMGARIYQIPRLGNGPLPLLIAVFIFLCTNNIKPFTNGIVNVFAATIFSGYLISEQPSFRYYLWHSILNFSGNKTNFFCLFFGGVFSGILVLIISFCIDTVRKKVFQLLHL